MTPPKLHRAAEAGRIVHKSASWMYQMGAAGLIPRTKIGRNVYWTDAQLAQIVRAGEQQPKPREQRKAEPQQKAATEPKAKPRAEKRKTAPPANVKNIPVADRSVSRLYKSEEAS